MADKNYALIYQDIGANSNDEPQEINIYLGLKKSGFAAAYPMLFGGSQDSHDKDAHDTIQRELAEDADGKLKITGLKRVLLQQSGGKSYAFYAARLLEEPSDFTLSQSEEFEEITFFGVRELLGRLNIKVRDFTDVDKGEFGSKLLRLTGTLDHSGTADSRQDYSNSLSLEALLYFFKQQVARLAS